MRIFLTGASGLVGGNVASVAARAGHHVVGTVGSWSGEKIVGLAEQHSIDLRDQLAIENAVLQARPDAILNCAAVADPATCEKDITLSQTLNVQLPETLARCAQRLGARIIHLSSEQVFDGQNAPYNFSDPVSPINLYGRQKAESERCVAAAAPKLSVTLRIPLLIGKSPSGKRGANERIALDLRSGKTLRLHTDEIRQVASAENIAHAMLELCGRREICGVFNWAGLTPVSRYELAVAIAEKIGAYKRLIEPAQLKGSPAAASRPADLRMNLSPLSELLRTKPQTLNEQLDRLY